MEFYEAMSQNLGPMHWWPGQTPFDVIVGAILTQNTAWTNVERAIENLRRETASEFYSDGKSFPPEAGPAYSVVWLLSAESQKAQSVRPVPAEELIVGRLLRMFATPTAKLRQELLVVHGIGPETADSILLYAGNHAIFVVDAYTQKNFTRHGLRHDKTIYDEVRAFFENHLSQDAQLYNEYHALIVNTRKNWCRSQKPRCEECPLGKFLPRDGFVGGGHSMTPKQRPSRLWLWLGGLLLLFYWPRFSRSARWIHDLDPE